MSDEDSFTGRVRRYARVGGAVGGLAARLAGERYLGMPIDRARHAADLKAALGGIKGPLMKVAQLLATIPDALPEEYVRELIQLQANAPAMGWPFVRRRMMGELGPDWQSRWLGCSLCHRAHFARRQHRGALLRLVLPVVVRMTLAKIRLPLGVARWRRGNDVRAAFIRCPKNHSISWHVQRIERVRRRLDAQG